MFKRIRISDNLDICYLFPILSKVYIMLWKFRLGSDLVQPEQVPLVPMRMRQLHQWYKSEENEMFGARYKHEHFHKGLGILWVKFEYLYEFYRKSAHDVVSESVRPGP